MHALNGNINKGKKGPGARPGKPRKTGTWVKKRTSTDRKYKPRSQACSSIDEHERKHSSDPTPLTVKMGPPKLFLCCTPTTCNRARHWHRRQKPSGAGSTTPLKGALLRLARKKAELCTLGDACKNPQHYHTTKTVSTVNPASADTVIDETPDADHKVDVKVESEPVMQEEEEEEPSEPNQLVMFLPAHRLNNTDFPSKTYSLPRAPYMHLKRVFPNPFPSHATMNALLASINKAYPMLSVRERQELVEAFTTEKAIDRASLRSPHLNTIAYDAVLNKNKSQAIYEPPSSFDSAEYIMGLGQTYDCGTFYRTYGEDAGVPQKMQSNGNFVLVNSRGWIPGTEEHPEIGTFETATNERPRWWKTTFLRLRGKQDFKLLDKTGKNYVGAMYRLFRHRDHVEGHATNFGEAELRANQLRLLNHVTPDDATLSMVSHRPLYIPPEQADSQGASTRRLAIKVFNSAIETALTGSTVSWIMSSAIFGSLLLLAIAMPAYARAIFVCLGAFYFGEAKPRPRSPLGWPLWATKMCCYCTTVAPTLMIADALTRITGTGAYYATFIPGVKQPLYRLWWLGNSVFSWHTEAEAEVKPGEVKFKKEWAKHQKHGRLFVSYGSSILNSGWFFPLLKTFFCRTWKFTVGDVGLWGHDGNLSNAPLGYEVQIVKALDEDADLPVIPPLGFSGRLFSDDMQFVWQDVGDTPPLMFDVDISGCDAGNTSAMFYLLVVLCRTLGAPFEMLRRSMRRLTSELICRNPSNAREFIRIQPVTIFQGSGCPETTSVNNIASFLISISIWITILLNLSVWRSATEDRRRRLIIDAAGYVGHQVSVDFRATRQECQFLKYSPARDLNSRWVNYRNLASIFRGLGSCDGDITAEMLGLSKAKFRELSMEQKGEMYMSGVISGLKNEPQSVVMNALRDRFCKSCPEIILNPYTQDQTDRSASYIPNEELVARYGGSTDTWDDLAVKIRSIRFGHSVIHEGITLMNAVDYGLIHHDD